MRAKLTMKVADLKDFVNHMLKNSTCSEKERDGAIQVLEHFLHVTGNYKGFIYLNECEVPIGHKAGISMDMNTMSNIFPDESRRKYS